MKLFKTWQLLLMFTINVMTITACSNSNAKGNDVSTNNDEKKEVFQQSTQNTPNLETELAKAKKAGKAVFVVITGTGVTDVDKALEIGKKATSLYKNSIVLKMDRNNASNSKIVSQWRLEGAPLPLILVVSPQGNPTGGYILSEATSQKLVDLIPSPKLDNVYSAITSGKAVFVIVSKKSYTDKAKIIANCKAAVTQLQNKAIVVEVDRTDTKEAKFITQLNINDTPNTSTVIVINSGGQTTGTFDGTAETSQLVLSANKVIKSGCCPSGGGASKGCK